MENKEAMENKETAMVEVNNSVRPLMVSHSDEKIAYVVGFLTPFVIGGAIKLSIRGARWAIAKIKSKKNPEVVEQPIQYDEYYGENEEYIAKEAKG